MPDPDPQYFPWITSTTPSSHLILHPSHHLIHHLSPPSPSPLLLNTSTLIPHPPSLNTAPSPLLPHLITHTSSLFSHPPTTSLLLIPHPSSLASPLLPYSSSLLPHLFSLISHPSSLTLPTHTSSLFPHPSSLTSTPIRLHPSPLALLLRKLHITSFLRFRKKS